MKVVQKSFKNVRSMTQQAPAGFMTPADIMNKYAQSGLVPNSYFSQRFGKRDMGMTLQKAYRDVEDAQLAFASLPSRIRDRFHNSPVELLKFLENRANLEEAISLGLIDKSIAIKEKVSTPEKVEEITTSSSEISSAN